MSEQTGSSPAPQPSDGLGPEKLTPKAQSFLLRLGQVIVVDLALHEREASRFNLSPEGQRHLEQLRRFVAEAAQ